MTEQTTDRLFIALASAIASIESGAIEEAEVESRHVQPDDTETTLVVTVRRHARPLLPAPDQD